MITLTKAASISSISSLSLETNLESIEGAFCRLEDRLPRQKYAFKLYIASNTINSQIAIINLQQICQDELNNECHIEVIDILEELEQAEAEKIVATPTLIQQFPSSNGRIIGNMSNRQQVLQQIAQN